MTGCIDRKTGKVTIIRGEDEAQLDAVVRRLLSAANLVKGGKKDEARAVLEVRENLGCERESRHEARVSLPGLRG